MALLNEYPISTVHALGKAAAVNRLYDTLAFSGAIAAGAVHAVEAGFSGKSPKALKGYQEGLLKSIRKMSDKPDPEVDNPDAQALLGSFGGGVRETRRGRRTDNSRGST